MATQEVILGDVRDIPAEYLELLHSFLLDLSSMLKMPACRIMIFQGDKFTTLANNIAPQQADAEQNVAPWYNGYFCKKVLKMGKCLYIADVENDPDWQQAKTKAKNIGSYLGFPLYWPDDRPFGTLCIIDTQPRLYSDSVIQLLEKFSKLIEFKLDLLYENRELETSYEDLESSYEDLELVATTDSLTGLLNRRGFKERSQIELERTARYQHDLCLLMIDLDHFKRINDKYGHDSGDVVLTTFANRMASLVRASDILGRIGGEEFAILMPETSIEQAYIFAERLRLNIAEMPIQLEQDTVHVRISIGVVQASGATDDLRQLLNLADKQLYRAKQTGRNKTCY